MKSRSKQFDYLASSRPVRQKTVRTLYGVLEAQAGMAKNPDSSKRKPHIGFGLQIECLNRDDVKSRQG